jgi:hypothetical protein
MNQRRAANDAAVKSDLKNIALTAQTLPRDATKLAKGATPGVDVTMNTRMTYFSGDVLKATDVRVSDGTWWTITGNSEKYCIIGYSKEGSEHTRTSPLTYDSTAGGLGKTGEACNPADITDANGNIIASGNVVDDPTFANLNAPTPQTGWTNRVAPYYSAPYTTVNITTPIGNKAVETTSASTTLPQGIIYFQPSTSKALAVSKTGEKWTVSAYVKAPVGAQMNMGVRITDIYGGHARETGMSFTGTGNWERVSHTMSAESIDIGYYPHIQIKNHNLVNGYKFQTAGPMVERSTTMSPFRAD